MNCIASIFWLYIILVKHLKVKRRFFFMVSYVSRFWIYNKRSFLFSLKPPDENRGVRQKFFVFFFSKFFFANWILLSERF